MVVNDPRDPKKDWPNSRRALSYPEWDWDQQLYLLNGRQTRTKPAGKRLSLVHYVIALRSQLFSFLIRVTLICSFSLVKRICLVPFKSDVTFKRKLEMNSHMLYVSDSYKTIDTDFLLCKKWKVNLSLYHLMLTFRIFSNHSSFKFISVI